MLNGFMYDELKKHTLRVYEVLKPYMIIQIGRIWERWTALKRENKRKYMSCLDKLQPKYSNIHLKIL